MKFQREDRGHHVSLWAELVDKGTSQLSLVLGGDNKKEGHLGSEVDSRVLGPGVLLLRTDTR